MNLYFSMTNLLSNKEILRLGMSYKFIDVSIEYL